MCKTNNGITEESASKQCGLHIFEKNAPGMEVPERLKGHMSATRVPFHKRVIGMGVGVNLLFKEEVTPYLFFFFETSNPTQDQESHTLLTEPVEVP